MSPHFMGGDININVSLLYWFSYSILPTFNLTVENIIFIFIYLFLSESTNYFNELQSGKRVVI